MRRGVCRGDGEDEEDGPEADDAPPCIEGRGGGGLPCEYLFEEGIGSRVELRRRMGPPTVVGIPPFVELLESEVISELTLWCCTKGGRLEGGGGGRAPPKGGNGGGGGVPW